uniref:Uncharacterized protein n=2 Tax=Kalanchoe fedtschenkoi TaxID=63787 RepID=A0A7N0US85_KALFE
MSEPPHIGRWFSSYEYESPDLNSGKAVDALVLRDTQLEKIRISVKESYGKRGKDCAEPSSLCRKRKMVEMCSKTNSPNLDDIQHYTNQKNAHSLSLPSEPPDIRNWFSSYVYESPELDISADVNISLFKEDLLDQQDIGVKQKSGENVNDTKCNKTPGNEFGVIEEGASAELTEFRSLLKSQDHNDSWYNDSLSLPSEPPDIRNRCASYVYESPGLFWDGDSGVSVVPETQSEIQDNGITLKDGGKKMSIHEKDTLTNSSQGTNLVEYDNHLGIHSVEVRGDKNHVCSPTPLGQIVEGKQRHAGIHTTSVMEIAKIVDEADSSPSRDKTPSYKNELRNPTRLFLGKNFTVKHSSVESCSKEEVSVAKPVSLSLNVLPTEVPRKNHDSNKRVILPEKLDESLERTDKENEQTDVTQNGFISTKKNRKEKGNRQNPDPIPEERRELADQDHLSITKKDPERNMTSDKKRMPLSDVTNVLQSTELETSGKWRCPQKSKPNLRPPMKQLRLEQWVTRV